MSALDNGGPHCSSEFGAGPATAPVPLTLVHNKGPLGRCREQFCTLLEPMNALTFTVDRNARFSGDSGQLPTFAGAGLAAVRGRAIQEVLGPSATRDAAIERAFGGERVKCDWITSAALGTRHIRMLLEPRRGAGGDIDHLVGMASDVTERTLLEAQLLQAQKLEAVGQLAAGIAHEINTPIQFIGDNLRFLADTFTTMQRVLEASSRLAERCRAVESLEPVASEFDALFAAAEVDYLSSEVPVAIGQALDGVSRVSGIVVAMNDFSHPDMSDKILLDINAAIEATITVSRHEWKYVAEVKTDFDPELPHVPCLAGQFNQTILNLLVNAAHAIGDEVQSGRQQRGVIRVATRSDGESVEIRVSDTGGGIPHAIQSRVFDPFFTTKPVGQGTGQGLANAQTVIAKKHGGWLGFETAVGQGTTFIVRLPIQPTER